MLTTSSTALIVGEAQPARAELLAEHAILGLEIVDQVTLVLVDPARQRNNEEPERKRERSQELSVAEGRTRLIQVASSPRAHSSARQDRACRHFDRVLGLYGVRTHDDR